MKKYLSLLIILFFLTACAQGQDSHTANIATSLQQWNDEAQTNIRLLPKYGYAVKSEGQKDADKKFIESTMQSYADKRAASNHLIELGFQYLYRNDVKTAMYRFNQAFLLDSTNTDIYWGYGAIYFALNDINSAEKQYTEGLALQPDNTHLLTDYATCFLSKYHEAINNDEKAANNYLDTALSYLSRSYHLNKTDANTTFKLSTCYLRKGDCKNARKYYNECKAAGGQPITEDYTQALNGFCK